MGNRHAVFSEGTSLVRADIGRTTHRFAGIQMAHQVVIFIVRRQHTVTFAVFSDPSKKSLRTLEHFHHGIGQ